MLESGIVLYMSELALPDPTFITLGPEGTCHQWAAQRYIEFQGLAGLASLELMGAIETEGIDRVHTEPNTFVIQNSAHPNVDIATERYPQEVFVADTFIETTRELALIARPGVTKPQTLGLVKATRGYPTDLEQWDVVDVAAKPEVAERLLVDEEFDAGLTSLECAREYSDEFRILEYFGRMQTGWLVYANRSRYQGQVVGRRIPDFFLGTEGFAT